MSADHESPEFGQGVSGRMSSIVRGVFAVFGVLVVGLLLMSLFLPVTRAREVPRRMQCTNNLKQIGLALHSYYERFGVLPPAYTVDASGQPLHSWRTLILPFMEHQPLYDSIDLSKPWDDPVNAVALRTKLSCYQCPSATLPGNFTAYLGCVGPDACLHPTESRRFADIKDGAANTLMVIEVDVEHAVPWMSPQDADVALVLNCGHEPRPNHASGTHGLLGDGRVKYLPRYLSLDGRRALVSIDGGEKLEDF